MATKDASAPELMPYAELCTVLRSYFWSKRPPVDFPVDDLVQDTICAWYYRYGQPHGKAFVFERNDLPLMFKIARARWADAWRQLGRERKLQEQSQRQPALTHGHQPKTPEQSLDEKLGHQQALHWIPQQMMTSIPAKGFAYALLGSEQAPRSVAAFAERDVRTIRRWRREGSAERAGQRLAGPPLPPWHDMPELGITTADIGWTLLNHYDYLSLLHPESRTTIGRELGLPTIERAAEEYDFMMVFLDGLNLDAMILSFCYKTDIRGAVDRGRPITYVDFKLSNRWAENLPQGLHLEKAGETVGYVDDIIENGEPIASEWVYATPVGIKKLRKSKLATKVPIGGTPQINYFLCHK